MPDLTIKFDIKRFFSSPRNIAIITSAILLAVIIISLINSNSKTQQFTGSESVVSPVDKNDISLSNEDYFKMISLRNGIAIERYVYSWQNIFDLFASNPENTKQHYDISTSILQKLSLNVKQTIPFSKGTSDDVLREYGDVIKEECKYYKLDYRLILAMIKQESAFMPEAVSHAGAYGFMQIMPRTGSALEQALQLEEHHSPKNNLIAGIYYYATLVGRYNQAGDTNKYKFALAAYNCGSGHVEDAMSIAYYFDENYFDWNTVKERLKQLAPSADSVHQLVWKSHPPKGTLANWKEPYNYVDRIIYFWEQYRLIYPEPFDKKEKKTKKKKQK